MNHHLLFIDTETTGLPKNWTSPISEEENWPHAVQVSWIIYDLNNKEVCRQNHYVQIGDIKINPVAMQIHGITPAFLKDNGQEPNDILRLLEADLLKYKPWVIGHFIKLDYFVLGAAYYRLGLPNPLAVLPVFCTMQATKNLVHNPWLQSLRLNDLYKALFHQDQPQSHNAMKDAEATAKCFYELLQRGEITEALMNRQNADSSKWRNPVKESKDWILFALFIFLLFILIAYYCHERSV